MSIVKIIEANGKKIARQKYDVLLKLVNMILEKIGKNKITNIVEFKDVDRDSLLSDDIIKIYEDMKEEIFEVYDKNSLMYTRSKQIKGYILTVLKIMCNQLGLKFKHTYQSIKMGDEITYVTYYSICI